MNLNVIGGTLGMAALVALFVLHDRHAAVPIPTPRPVTAPAPVSVPEPAAPSIPNVIYHRVEQGGAQGPEIACTSVKLFATGKSPAELAATAKQYGVSVETLKRYYVCI